MTALLEARHVTKTFASGPFAYHRIVALRDFSLTITGEPPVVIGVVGESGSGKTTMARLLLGLDRPSSGQVLYRGKDLQGLSRAERRRFLQDVQPIFQDPFEVFNTFYPVDHVLLTPIAKLGLARSKREAQALAEKALQTVGLRPEETLRRYPHQLSGGQRQRVMVARALLFQPKLIIADEPVSMIDASLRGTVLANLHQLNQEFGISLIYITHDLTTAYQISNHLIVLYQGLTVEIGDAELVVKTPQHPYTQLLINSIPVPNPYRRWSSELPTFAATDQDRDRTGCPFAARCPHTFSLCRERAPTLFQTYERRAVACHLYRDHTSIAGREIGQTLIAEGTAEEPGKSPTQHV